MATLLKWLLADIGFQWGFDWRFRALYVLAFDYYTYNGEFTLNAYVLNLCLSVWLCPKVK